MNKQPNLIEALESRIAPAAVFTFTDVDGDLVKITTSKGSNFDLKNATHVVKGQLQLLDLSSAMFGGEFSGADITFSAVPQAGKGDGHVNVGFINATGNDLGNVTIPGDLGKIVAGKLSEPAPAVKTLSVASIGAFNDFTQAPGGDLNSEFKGGLGKFTVLGAVDYASLKVTGGAAGKLGSAYIGADMPGSTLQIDGDLGSVKVGGSLVGTGTVGTGVISAGGNIGSVTVGGSVRGTSMSSTGQIFALGNIGSVKIGGDLIGAFGPSSGEVEAFGDVGSIVIGGKIHGDQGSSSGSVTVAGKLGKLIVGGDLEGGLGSYSGSISVGKASGSIALGGSVVGGGAYAAGSVLVTKSLASLTIKGSLVGGTSSHAGVVLGGDIAVLKIGGNLSGAGLAVSDVAEIVANKLGAVTIGGSILGVDLFAQVENNGSIRSHTSIGSLTVGGSIQSIGMGEPVISALHSIGKITVAGEVFRASILAGYDIDGKGVNADAQIGAVKVGSWTSSNLVAGVNPGLDGIFGTANDIKLSGGKAEVISKIASVTVVGQASGSNACGIVAQQIGSFKVGAFSYGFTAAKNEMFKVGASNGAIGDLVAREVA